MEGRSLIPSVSRKKIVRSDAFYWEHEGIVRSSTGDGSWSRAFPIGGSCTIWRPIAARLHDLAGSDSARVQSMVARYDGWAARCNVRPWDEVRKIPATDAGG